MPAPSALSISATDPEGGLLAADLLVFETLGVLGSGVVTALTAHGLRQAGPVHDVPVPILRASLEAVLSTRPPSSVKAGVLTTVAAVRTVARAISGTSIPLVVDPGFIPRSGPRLLRSTVADAVVRDLFPSAVLVTLNLLETATLAGFPIRNETDAKVAARRIQALGPAAVLVTGGGAEDATVIDGFLDGRTWLRFECLRSEVPPPSGAGGLLSAAVTAWLAAGETLPDAVSRAIDFAHRSFAAEWSTRPGGLVYALHSARPSRV